MNTLVNFILAIGWVISFSTVSISSTMLRTHDADSLSVYPFVVIGAVAYLHWFVWYAFVPLKTLPDAEREVLQARMNDHYSKGTFNRSIGLGYLFVLGYAVEWFVVPGDSSQSHFYNPLWYGLMFIGAGLLSRLHGLLRFLLLERK